MASNRTDISQDNPFETEIDGMMMGSGASGEKSDPSGEDMPLRRLRDYTAIDYDSIEDPFQTKSKISTKFATTSTFREDDETEPIVAKKMDDTWGERKKLPAPKRAQNSPRKVKFGTRSGGKRGQLSKKKTGTTPRVDKRRINENFSPLEQKSPDVTVVPAEAGRASKIASRNASKLAARGSAESARQNKAEEEADVIIPKLEGIENSWQEPAGQKKGKVSEDADSEERERELLLMKKKKAYAFDFDNMTDMDDPFATKSKISTSFESTNATRDTAKDGKDSGKLSDEDEWKDRSVKRPVPAKVKEKRMELKELTERGGLPVGTPRISPRLSPRTLGTPHATSPRTTTQTHMTPRGSQDGTSGRKSLKLTPRNETFSPLKEKAGVTVVPVSQPTAVDFESVEDPFATRSKISTSFRTSEAKDDTGGDDVASDEWQRKVRPHPSGTPRGRRLKTGHGPKAGSTPRRRKLEKNTDFDPLAKSPNTTVIAANAKAEEKVAQAPPVEDATAEKEKPWKKKISKSKVVAADAKPLNEAGSVEEHMLKKRHQIPVENPTKRGKVADDEIKSENVAASPSAKASKRAPSGKIQKKFRAKKEDEDSGKEDQRIHPKKIRIKQPVQEEEGSDSEDEIIFNPKKAGRKPFEDALHKKHTENDSPSITPPTTSPVFDKSSEATFPATDPVPQILDIKHQQSQQPKGTKGPKAAADANAEPTRLDSDSEFKTPRDHIEPSPPKITNEKKPPQSLNIHSLTPGKRRRKDDADAAAEDDGAKSGAPTTSALLLEGNEIHKPNFSREVHFAKNKGKDKDGQPPAVSASPSIPALPIAQMQQQTAQGRGYQDFFEEELNVDMSSLAKAHEGKPSHRFEIEDIPKYSMKDVLLLKGRFDERLTSYRDEFTRDMELATFERDQLRGDIDKEKERVKKYMSVLNKYEGEMEDFVGNSNEKMSKAQSSLKAAQRENSDLKSQLETVNRSFEEFRRKYSEIESQKLMLEQNLEITKERSAKMERDLSISQERYNKLKNVATGKLEEANKALLRKHEDYDKEKAVISAKLDFKESRIQQLVREIEFKEKENARLTEIVDKWMKSKE